MENQVKEPTTNGLPSVPFTPATNSGLVKSDAAWLNPRVAGLGFTIDQNSGLVKSDAALIVT